MCTLKLLTQHLICLFFLFNFLYLFLTMLGLCRCMDFLWIRWVGASLCRGARASHCGGFSCRRAQGLGGEGFIGRSTWAPGLSGCGA